MSAVFELKVGDPDAPKIAFRHTGLDTYAVRSPPTLTGSDCAAGCASSRLFFAEDEEEDEEEEEEEGEGEGEEEEDEVVVEPRIG